MEIKIIKSVEDAHTATGLAVVIDVLRAFSVQAYLFANGAERIIPVQSLEEAFALKEANPGFVLLGERGGIKVEGFDYGNSPTEIVDIDFSGRTIIHTTSNGTKGLLNARNAEPVLAGSFLVADSIVAFIRKNNIDTVSLISTSPSSETENEDILLAHYIRDALKGKATDQSGIRTLAGKTKAYTRLFNEIGVPATDFDLCFDFNRFKFVIKKVVDGEQYYLVKEETL